MAILGDLQGPKLRVGEIEGGGMPVSPGDKFIFTSQKIIGNKEKLYIHYPNFHKDVKVGNKIMIDDGKLEVIVKKILPNTDVQVEVLLGGFISSKKGVNLPDTKFLYQPLHRKTWPTLTLLSSRSWIG